MARSDKSRRRPPSGAGNNRNEASGSSWLDAIIGDEEEQGDVSGIVADLDHDALVYVTSCLLLEGAAVTYTTTKNGDSVGVSIANGGRRPTRWFTSADSLNAYLLDLAEKFSTKYPVD